MALEGQHKAKVEIEAKTTAAQKDIKKLVKRVDQLERKLSKAQKTGKKQEVALGKMAKRFDVASKSLSNFNKIMGAGGLVAAGLAAVKTLDQLVDRGARFSFVTQNIPFSINKARKATKGWVTDMELAQAASNAARLGVTKNEEEFAKLADTATKLALSTGRDAASGIDDLTLALGRGSPMILDNLGIVLRQSEAYERYAKKIGVSANELTNAQKKQAFMTEALIEAEKAAGNVTLEVDSATESWLGLKAEMQNWADETVPVVVGGIGAMVDAFHWLDNSIYDAKAGFGPRTDKRGFIGNAEAGSVVDQGALKKINARRAQSAANAENIVKAMGTFESTYHEAMTSRFYNEMMVHVKRSHRLGKKLPGPGRKKKKKKEEIRTDLGPPVFGIEDISKAIVEGSRETEHSLKVQAVDDEIIKKQQLLELDRARAEENEVFFKREQELLDLRLEKNELMDAGREKRMEREQILHEKRLLQIEEEKHAEEMKVKRRKDLAKDLRTVAQVEEGLMRSGMGLLDTVAAHRKARGKQIALDEGKRAGLQALFIGGLEVVKAVASFADFNYVQGALHVAAAGVAFAQGALMLSGSPPKSDANLGGGSGGPLGNNRYSGNNRTRNSSTPTIPGSDPSANAKQEASSEPTKKVEQNFFIVGDIDDDAAIKIKQATDNISENRDVKS